MNRNTTTVALCAFMLGIALASFWPRATAQDAAPKAANGRYQLSVIPGAAYLLDTQTGDVHVREYQTKRWGSAGNPFKQN